MLILKALSLGASHGYAIAVWLQSHADGALGLDDSALYQALHRLEGRRLVAAEWGRTENNRRARFYRLTPRGANHLERASDTWRRYADWVGGILALEAPRRG